EFASKRTRGPPACGILLVVIPIIAARRLRNPLHLASRCKSEGKGKSQGKGREEMINQGRG
ncbi:hypothetical protein D6833_02785, partial [Candidatus Parcubacteria bacterium]